ncbi:hypothetical protein [Endozoicomonas sp. G2_1]|nr:hypothetical protein [Endozoicomonas sp. G2_1]
MKSQTLTTELKLQTKSVCWQGIVVKQDNPVVWCHRFAACKDIR